MKLLLFADHQVGLDVLNYLLEDYCEDISLVVTTSENDIYRKSRSMGIQTEVYDKQKNQSMAFDKEFDLGILAWWPYIIRNPLINIPKHGFINFHPSLLPFNRGKHYNFWAIVEQSPFGVTLHQVNEDIDSGNIVSQQPIDYDWTDNGESLYWKAQREMVSLFKKTYPKLRNGTFDTLTQDLTKGSFHHSSEIEHASKIDLNKNYTARHLLNLLRARTFDGYPACWFEDNGEQYEIKINIKGKNND